MELGRIVTSVVTKALIYVVVPAAFFVGGYCWWALQRLHHQLMGEEGIHQINYQLSLESADESPISGFSGTVMRALVRRLDGHNWLTTNENELIFGYYEWRGDAGARTRLPLTDAQEAEASRLREFAEGLVPDLIDGLESEDRRLREVAVIELRLRTRQRFGFHPGRDPKAQAGTIAEWRVWWRENEREFRE